MAPGRRVLVPYVTLLFSLVVNYNKHRKGKKKKKEFFDICLFNLHVIIIMGICNDFNCLNCL